MLMKIGVLIIMNNLSPKLFEFYFWLEHNPRKPIHNISKCDLKQNYMTNEQILKKAIEKAVKNGWDSDKYGHKDSEWELLRN